MILALGNWKDSNDYDESEFIFYNLQNGNMSSCPDVESSHMLY